MSTEGPEIYREMAKRFFASSDNAYALLQVKDDPAYRYERFSSLDTLEREGKTPDAAHYNIVYTSQLPPFLDMNSLLEGLYDRFNMDLPTDYHAHSMSVSDIVAIRQAGVVSCFYCDSVGFRRLDMELKPENYLKAAEMSMEDDYGMLDGIINNGKAPQMETESSMLQELRVKVESCKDTQTRKKTTNKERRPLCNLAGMRKS